MRIVLGIGLAAVLSAPGCVETGGVECADGRLCPDGTVCDLANATCVVPGGLYIPDGVVQLNSVNCGSAATSTLTISNFGDDTMSFEANSTLDLVTVVPATASLPPGGSIELIVTADASGGSLPIGPMEGAIYFTTDDGLVPRIVELTIAGAVVTASSGVVNFGIASLDDLPPPKSVTLTNSGNSAVDVTINDPGAPFTLSALGPLTIEANSSVDIDVTFAPSFNGEHSSAATLSYSGALCESPPTSVDLSGAISDASVLVNTTVLDFGTTGCGVTATSTDVTFSTNSGVDQVLSFSFSGADTGDYTPIGSVVLETGTTEVVAFERAAIAGMKTTGPKSATVTVTVTPAGETFDIDMSHVVSAAVLTTTDNLLDFGVVPLLSSNTLSVVVSNDGNKGETVQVTPPLVPLPNNGSLFVTPSSFFLEKDGSQTVDFTFDVAKVGGYAMTPTPFTFGAANQCGPVPVVSAQGVAGPISF